MTMSKSELKKSIPLYSDLAELLLEFLEPCLDYDVPKCTHKNAFCQCGNIFEFHGVKNILLENYMFCW